MKIALIGATGFVGTALLKELLDRGHEVTAIARHIDKLPVSEYLHPKKGDILDPAAVAELVKGHDAVISAYNPGWTNPNIVADIKKGTVAIEEGVVKSGVKRFIFIGGAGSLEIGGVRLVDSPSFPAEIKPAATAVGEYLDVLRKNTVLDWTFFSPAIFMNPEVSGVRKGHYRTGLDNPVFDEKGQCVLSVEDLAVAVVDELETPKHIRQRFTAAY